MKIVSLEWFEQSLERGMVLEEALYNPTIPAEERGQGAWDRREFPSPTIGKRPREAEPSQALNPFRRKLRRSASTRMGTQSEALWAGITAVSLERQHDDGDDWTEEALPQQDTPRQHTPTTRVEDPAAAEDDGPTVADPACELRQPPPLYTNGNSTNGIFEGRIVFPHGFDEDKVTGPTGSFWTLLTAQPGQYPTTPSARSWRSGSTKCRAQHFSV
jgi:DNA replication regulator DPB11